jgi:hypothetical protein
MKTKFILPLLIAVCLAAGRLAAGTAIVPILDNSQNPLPGVLCIVTAESLPQPAGAGVAVLSRTNYTTDGNGQFVISNCVPGLINVKPVGNNFAAFEFIMPATNGTVYAQQYLYYGPPPNLSSNYPTFAQGDIRWGGAQWQAANTWGISTNTIYVPPVVTYTYTTNQNTNLLFVVGSNPNIDGQYQWMGMDYGGVYPLSEVNVITNTVPGAIWRLFTTNASLLFSCFNINPTATWVTAGGSSAPTVTFGTNIVATPVTNAPGYYTNLAAVVYAGAISNSMILGSLVNAAQTMVFSNLQSYNINLQSLLDSLPVNSGLTNATGGEIDFGPGVFYTGANNYFTNLGVHNLKLKGSGGAGTCLVFTNAGDGLIVGNAGAGLWLEIDGMTIASTVDCPNFLINANELSRLTMHDIMLTYWTDHLAAVMGLIAGGQWAGTFNSTPPIASYLSGMSVSNCSSAVEMDFCNISFLQNGVWFFGDHFRMRNVFFDFVGCGPATNTGWTDLGRTDLSTGSSFIANNGMGDDSFVGCHWSGCNSVLLDELLNYAGNAFNASITFSDGAIEGCHYRVLMATNVPACPGYIASGPVTFLNVPYYKVGGTVPIDTMCTWSNNSSPVIYGSSVVPNVFELMPPITSSTNLAMTIKAGGLTVAKFAADGSAYIPSAKITRLNLEVTNSSPSFTPGSTTPRLWFPVTNGTAVYYLPAY